MSEALEPISPISFEEIAGEQQQAPPAVIPPAPATPAPAPKTEVEAPVSLENLFGSVEPKPADTPPVEGEEPPINPEEKGLPARLREELSRSKKEAREQADTLRQEAEEYRARYRELEEQFDMFRREMSVTDPNHAPEVIEATSNLERNVTNISKTLPPQIARSFRKNAKAFIDAYGQLGDINDAEYDKKHEELSRALAREFGGHSDEIMRTLPSLSELAEKLNTAVSSASIASSDVLVTRALKAHQDSAKMFDDVVTGTLSYSDEVAKADPYNPRNIVSNLIKQAPDFASKSKQLTEYLRSGLVPPAPLSREAEVGMTPEDKRQAITLMNQNFAQTSQNIYANTPLAFHAQLALPHITRMYAEMKQKYDALVGSAPSETRQSGQDHQDPAKPSEPPVNGVRPITMEELIQQ